MAGLPALFGAGPDYQRDVHPILAANCFQCHAGDKRSGGLAMNSYAELLKGGRDGAAIQPGRSSGSLLIERVTSQDSPMPPSGRRLTAAEIETLRNWIDEGARQSPEGPAAKTPWIAKLELVKPTLPEGTARHPVDRFIAAHLRERGETMPAPVPDRQFARRAYLDIHGLLPAPEQLSAFVNSREPDKRARLVAALLEDGRSYAEHWMSFWNDLLRNDEGVNYAGTRKTITPWLYDALRNNLPYDQFLQKLLNPVAPDDPDGFLVGVNWRGDVNASQLPVIQASQNTAQIFLGINFKCNSCHDSFISKWKLKDAYGLAGFFSPEDRLELVRCDNATGQFTAARFPFPQLDLPEPPKSLPERRAAAARMFTDARNGRTPRTLVNRIWARLLGRGLVADVDEMDGEPWSPELLDWLAAEFVEHGYDLKHLMATIMTSRAYQLPSVRRSQKEINDYVFRGPEVRRLTAEEFVDAMSAITGEWPVYTAGQGTRGLYSRQWRMPSTFLTRGLGRPIRDQVFTERNQDATTLQALELVNGDALMHLLARGARRMLGELPPPPQNLYDSGVVSRKPVTMDVDVTAVKELRLVTTDVLSYSPDRVLPVLANAVLVSANGETTSLGSLQPSSGSVSNAEVTLAGAKHAGALRTALPSEVVYDIAGKGYTRLRAIAGVADECIQDDISPRVRFFVFDRKPDPDSLVKVEPGTPAPPVRIPRNPDGLAAAIFEYMIGRPPSATERDLALATLAPSGRVTAEGLADLLWAAAMQPEFQFIY
jgi:hypothetical protein